MAPVRLSHPSQRKKRDAIYAELRKGGWFQQNDSFSHLLNALSVPRYPNKLVDSVEICLGLSKVDYNFLLKIALTNWMMDSKVQATVPSLISILKSNRFAEASAAIKCLEEKSIKATTAISRTLTANQVQMQMCSGGGKQREDKSRVHHKMRKEKVTKSVRHEQLMYERQIESEVISSCDSFSDS